MSIEKKIKPSYWNKMMVKKINESREAASQSDKICEPTAQDWLDYQEWSDSQIDWFSDEIILDCQVQFEEN